MLLIVYCLMIAFHDFQFINFKINFQQVVNGTKRYSPLLAIRITVHFVHYYQSLKEVRHIEMPKVAPKQSICYFQKLEMILK